MKNMDKLLIASSKLTNNFAGPVIAVSGRMWCMDRQLCYTVVSYGNNFVISLGILANFCNIFEAVYCVWDTLRLSYLNRSRTEENYGVKFKRY